MFENNYNFDCAFRKGIKNFMNNFEYNKSNKKIAYIDYDKNLNKNFLWKIFCKLKIIEFENEINIILSKNNLKGRRIKKIKKALNKNNITHIVFSNQINYNKNCFSEYIQLNGKILLKNIILHILKFIYNNLQKNIQMQEIYITIADDKNKDIVIDLANNFKCINIVTDKIKKLKRLEKILDKDENIIYSISSNTKKSLRKANIIINLDYDNTFFEKFKVNRTAVIINLNREQIHLKNSHNGCVIENVIFNSKLEYNVNKNNFNKNNLLEAKVLNKNYYEIKDLFEENCEIINLVGNNGNIHLNDFKTLA